MSDLLTNSPYARWNPEKDPYLQRYKADFTPGRSLVEVAAGTPETALTIGTSLLSLPRAGWAGLLTASQPEESRPMGFYMDGKWVPSLMGDVPMPPEAAVEQVMEEGTFLPRSRYGQENLQGLGEAVETALEPVTRLTDYAISEGMESGVSPAVLAGGLSFLQGAMETVPVNRPAATAKRAAAAVPREVGTSLDELGQIAQHLSKYDDRIAAQLMDYDAKLGTNLLGRSQRGSIQDTGGGKEVLATQATRTGLLHTPERKLKAGEFNLQPQSRKARGDFNQSLSEARQAMSDQDRLQVDAALPENFQGKTYITEDGAAGFAMSEDGYISNLFRHPDAEFSGTMGAALTKARAEGAKNLDAFDTYLARNYIARGATETGRMPFNPEYAPPGWDAARMGRPDYVEMDIGGVIPTQKHSEIIGPREQVGLLRQPTPRGEPPVVAESFRGGRVGRLNRIVDEGVEAGGDKWYYMAGMLDQFINELGPDQGVKRFDEFMDLNAAVSPRSTVAQQIKRASVLYQMQRRGESLKDVPASAFPPGYGHLAHTTAHVPGLNRFAQTGAIGSSVGQPKVVSYAENLKGNYQPVTVDTHNNLIITGRNASPGGAQYPWLESRQVDLGARRDMSPAEWQAALWVGGGDITGVRDVRNFPDAMNQRIAKTAEVLDIPEQEALVRFMHGDTQLYSVMGAMFLGGALAGQAEGDVPVSEQ